MFQIFVDELHKFCYIYLCKRKQQEVTNMNPYYVTSCWNNELKKCVYKVMERRWFQLARYLISIGSLSDQAAEEYENNGYKLECLPKEERIVKSKRKAMMNNAFNLGFHNGFYSKTWAMFLQNGFIRPRAGWYETKHERWYGGHTYSEAANGRKGYLLTEYGIKEYMGVLTKLSEYRKQAEIRCAKKNGIEYKEHSIFEEC